MNTAAGRLAARSTMALCAEQPPDPKQEIFICGFLRSSTEPLKLPRTPLQATLRAAGLCWVFGFQSLAGSSEHGAGGRSATTDPRPQQQPTKGTLRHSYCPEPLLKTLIALLPCLLRVESCVRHIALQLNFRSPTLSSSESGQGTLPHSF